MISQNRPVILGSSLTGLLVSLSLSRKGIPHTLIGGGPPNDNPRLGESLNECASPGLWLDLGHRFRECFFTKSHISLFNGDQTSIIYIADPKKSLSRADQLIGESGKRPPLWKIFMSALNGSSLMHVNRVEFDKQVYEYAIQQPQCNFENAMVEHVDIGEDDRVSQISLSDGRTIDQPHYVFDTLGFRSPITAAAGLETNSISEQQRVVWTHYESPNGAPPRTEELWWCGGTNLLRLDEERDGVDGIAWMIPLGKTLSVGISVDNDRFGEDTMGVEDLRQNLDDAFARRGVEYRKWYPLHEKKTMHIVHRYYQRERAFGANWVLAGGSYISIWFPSSAGLWTSWAVSRMAEQLIRDPLTMGQRYQDIMTEPLLRFHRHLEGMVHGDVFQDSRQTFDFWSRWMAGIPHRLGDYLYLESGGAGLNRYGWLKVFSNLTRRFTALQLLSWGFFVTRVRKPRQMKEQSSSIRGYHKRVLFYLVNHLRNPLQYLGLLK